MSFVCTRPVEAAMALGGVDIGNIMYPTAEPQPAMAADTLLPEVRDVLEEYVSLVGVRCPPADPVSAFAGIVKRERSPESE